MKIETLLQAKATADDIHDKAMLHAIDEVREDVKAIRTDLDEEKNRNRDLRSRGAGILIGVAIAAGGIGAGFSKFWSWLAGLAT